MATEPGLFFAKDRATWTAWLEQFHATAPEIRLMFYRKGTGKECITYDAAVEEALCFGWIDGILHKLDHERFCYRFTPRRKGSAWSASNKIRVEKLDAAGKIRPAGQRAIDEAKDNGAWDKPAKAVMPDAMPRELALALAKNIEAKAAYELQAPSKKAAWQKWVHQAKQPATRERRAKDAATRLANDDPHPWLLGRTVEKAKANAKAAKKR